MSYNIIKNNSKYNSKLAYNLTGLELYRIVVIGIRRPDLLKSIYDKKVSSSNKYVKLSGIDVKNIVEAISCQTDELKSIKNKPRYGTKFEFILTGQDVKAIIDAIETNCSLLTEYIIYSFKVTVEDPGALALTITSPIDTYVINYYEDVLTVQADHPYFFTQIKQSVEYPTDQEFYLIVDSTEDVSGWTLNQTGIGTVPIVWTPDVTASLIDDSGCFIALETLPEILPPAIWTINNFRIPDFIDLSDNIVASTQLSKYCKASFGGNPTVVVRNVGDDFELSITNALVGDLGIYSNGITNWGIDIDGGAPVPSLNNPSFNPC